MEEQSKKFKEYLSLKKRINNYELDEMIDKIYDEVLEQKEKVNKQEEHKENEER